MLEVARGAVTYCTLSGEGNWLCRRRNRLEREEGKGLNESAVGGIFPSLLLKRLRRAEEEGNSFLGRVLLLPFGSATNRGRERMSDSWVHLGSVGEREEEAKDAEGGKSTF